MVSKIAEDMAPPVPVQEVLIFLSKIIPQAKLVPQKDFAELAFRELKKREMVRSISSLNIAVYLTDLIQGIAASNNKRFSSYL